MPSTRNRLFGSRPWVVTACLLPIVAACGSKNEDTLIGENIDMNALVQTNAEENMGVANTPSSTGARSGESNSAKQSTTEAQARPASVRNAASDVSVNAVNPDDRGEAGVNRVQPEEPQPSNRSD